LAKAVAIGTAAKKRFAPAPRKSMNSIFLSIPEPFHHLLVLFWEELQVLFSLGLQSAIFLEIIKRTERIFSKEGSLNWTLVHRERPFFKREFRSELCWPLFNVLILPPFLALEQYILVEALLEPNFAARPLAAGIQSLPFWVQVVLGLLVLDLILYVRHRFVHHFFWPYHTVHHAAREITWLTTLRLHPIDVFAMGLVFTTMAFFLGFSGEGIAMATVIQFHINRFVHSNISLDYGVPLRYIFVSPNMHRWHHAAGDPEAINKNFAIVFAWIDVLFGTYYVPKNRLPTTYGVLDENGEQVVTEDYLSQLVYPLVAHRKWAVDTWKQMRDKAKR
jgi:sterol desaturase/sphingolipid hydroxylase (fatty acid hydroxylase superfamily)